MPISRRGTGLDDRVRRSELLTLRWRQIELTSRTVRVGESKTRAGRGRIVPLNDRATAVLSFWAEFFPDRQGDHAVFPTERVGATGDAFKDHVSDTDPLVPIGSLKTAWTTAKRAAGVSMRWHDLRHTRLLEQGVSLPIVGQILGWSASTTIRMAQRYGHIGQNAQRQAMALLDRPNEDTQPASHEQAETASLAANAVH